MKKATRQHTKEHNRILVLKTIMGVECISRAEIARATSLTPTTVSDIVADLLAEGLVDEVGVGSSVGGKSPILLGLVEDSRWLIGLDLAHNQFRGAVVNLRGKIRNLVTIPVNDRNGEDALALVYDILDQLVGEATQPLLGIGVGTPGLVNTAEGVVINAVNLNWKNLPLTKLLQERYRLPVYVLNDSQAAAIGEYTYGKDHHADEHLVVINVRHGIGAGIVINGSLFQGDGGSAGEIGHVVVVPQGGLPCRCGNYGCLETVASAQAIVKRMRTLAGQAPDTGVSASTQPVSLETIEQAYKAGDTLANQVVTEAGQSMGKAIAGLVGVLNINKIVLSGDMTLFGEPWLITIVETMRGASLAGPVHDAKVEIGQLGTNGIILGTTAMLANNYSLLFTDTTAPEGAF
jgi:predicted NBD/HSP70 family sugar kinase